MKKFSILVIASALTLFISCGKQQSEAEKTTEIERQVQERLAAERQADEQQKLAQRESELRARENALAEKEQAARQSATPEMRATQTQREADDVKPREEPGTTSYDTFYTKLEPYGAWRETSDYGYVWQPNVAERSRSWRPYTNGRWVYTDAGWTWYSEEPFGWATYHYGRWTRLRNVGWVWVPGDEWAPAWVSWRKSDDYVGWAALPPEAHFDRRTGIHNWADNYYDIGPEQYAFVPSNDFGNRQIERTVLPPARNVTIINQTINVTNITYNNTTIVNQGPNYEDLRQRSRQPIERLRLERRSGVEDENPRAIVRGEVIEMPAPLIAPAWRAARPRAVKERISEAVVDHSWTEIGDRQAAEQARAKMRSEATPPPGIPPRKFGRAANEATRAATASATPIRNLPPPSKMTPAPTVAATATPKPAATASAPADPPSAEQREATKRQKQSQARQEKVEAQRKLMEAQKAQKKKLRAEEKTAQQQKEAEKAAKQQKAEELRRMKAERKQSPSPPPAVTASALSSPAPPVPAIPRAKPPVPPSAKTIPERSPARGKPQLPSPTATLTPSASPNGSPAAAMPGDSEKNGEDKKKRKRDRENKAASPTIAPR